MTKKQIYNALIKMQAELTNVPKTGNNPHFHSKYAEYSSVANHLRPFLAKYDLGYNHEGYHDGTGGTYIQTTLFHSSGETLVSVLPLKPSKTNEQGVGSCISYWKRYNLLMLTGLADGNEDDDANSAVGNPTPAAAAPKKVWPQQNKKYTPPPQATTQGGTEITFGKYKGQMLEDIDPLEVQGYLMFLEKKARGDGKPLGRSAEELKKLNDARLDKAQPEPIPPPTDDDIPF